MDYLLHHLLRTSAESFPDRMAAAEENRSIAYAELDARANQVARLLLDLGVSRGDRVGLYLNKSLEALIGIYGILKAGAAYVPLDPNAPAKRLAYIAANCGLNVLLTGVEKEQVWGELLAEGAPLTAMVVLNSRNSPKHEFSHEIRVLTTEAVDAQETSDPEVHAIGLDLAYILYTSGSTGAPKGVMLSHLNALSFVKWATELTSVSPEDRLSSHAPLHFDLSIFDIFGAARAAAEVVLVPPDVSIFPVRIPEFTERHGITVWYSVPSVLTMLVQRGNLKPRDLPRLRTVYFAGEVFPTKYLRQLMQLLPHVAFYNLYGPTETNVCTYYEVRELPEDQTDPIPIGTAIEDVEVFAVTEDGRIARYGEVGELHVRGTTVMQGYWGDPERTGKVLFPHPFRGEVRDPVYRTGDLVIRGDDENYRLLGRRDHQIKSRGYRIELGEIESALYGHPAVVACAVIAVPDEMITNRIKAFVVVRDGVTRPELIRFCSERIPHYMIPERFEFRDALPKTSTGKVDRQALSRDSDPQPVRRS
jgi:amino acid adenylation domain-containing protein